MLRGERARRARRSGRGTRLWIALAVVSGLGLTAVAQATHIPGDDVLGHTTLDQVLSGGDPTTGYKTLSVDTANPDPLVVRDGTSAGDGAPLAQEGRELRRRSLSYFSQTTDFQLSDEESPARVEFTDNDPSGTARSAWRPQEALIPFEVNATVEQINQFAAQSPFPQGDGSRNAMDFTLATGDQADNMQRNENLWVRDLLEGRGPLTFNSGGPVTDTTLPGCAVPASVPGTTEAAKYTGVQDYDDYTNTSNYFYDPDNPQGSWQTDPSQHPPGSAHGGWPTYPGLMDRAQRYSFTPAGLDNPATVADNDLPFYVTNGNHDTLVQGNQAANQNFERIAMGCYKPLSSTSPPVPGGGGPDSLDPGVLTCALTMTCPGSTLVPPDPLRRFAAKPQVKAIYSANGEDNGHGFGFVPTAENAASNGSASYYAWDPPQAPGFRFINIDTNAEGGVVGPGSDGNLDDPQFQWLEDELAAAQEDDKLIVVWGHHPVRSMTADLADEAAPACTTNDTHGDTPEHDVNPGCDLDPRSSEPIHLGNQASSSCGGPQDCRSFVELLDDFPNVIAYVPGHTHVNRILPRGLSSNPTGLSGPIWWELNTSAVADWPTQSRLVDIMDNRDDTLSIFTALIDHAGMAAAAASGTQACGSTTPNDCADGDGFDSDQLASIGRTFAYNDPEDGDAEHSSDPLKDRNAELLVFDPREADLSVTKSDSPDPVQASDELTYTLEVTDNDPAEDQSGATGVSLVDELPPTAQFVSATPSTGSCSHTGGTFGGSVNCALGDFASQDSATVTIKVRPQTAGTITNQATVNSILKDPNPANDSDSEDTTVTPLPGSADLSLTKTVSPTFLTVGDPLTYDHSVHNGGPNIATGVAITDALPNGVSFNSASASQGSCSNDSGVVTCVLGTMTNGATATAQIHVTAQALGTIVNEATTASGVGDPTTSNNTASAGVQVNPKPGTAATPAPAPIAKKKCKKRKRRHHHASTARKKRCHKRKHR
jgi:uncharacterized repeat protein (TIGR01451 family)